VNALQWNCSTLGKLRCSSPRECNRPCSRNCNSGHSTCRSRNNPHHQRRRQKCSNGEVWASVGAGVPHLEHTHRAACRMSQIRRGSRRADGQESCIETAPSSGVECKLRWICNRGSRNGWLTRSKAANVMHSVAPAGFRQYRRNTPTALPSLCPGLWPGTRAGKCSLDDERKSASSFREKIW
jgi:hypothetical protein